MQNYLSKRDDRDDEGLVGEIVVGNPRKCEVYDSCKRLAKLVKSGAMSRDDATDFHLRVCLSNPEDCPRGEK